MCQSNDICTVSVCVSSLHHSASLHGSIAAWGNVCVAAPPIRLAVDILIVTTMTSVWTVNSTLSWGCNYLMQSNLDRSLQLLNRKLLLTLSAHAANFQNSVFSPLQMPPLHCDTQGRMSPFAPPPFPLPLAGPNFLSNVNNYQVSTYICSRQIHLCRLWSAYKVVTQKNATG